MKSKKAYSKENVNYCAEVWDSSIIKLIDIRHNIINSKEYLKNYKMPAAMFFYIYGGKAEVTLDDITYKIERFGIFHGGKGTRVSIKPIDDILEYYTLVYKCKSISFYKRDVEKLIEKVNPFKERFGFSPSNPIYFRKEFSRIYEQWNSLTPVNLIYCKASFYRILYEICVELSSDVHIFQPSVVTMAKEYMNEHYSENIAIRELPSMLNISYSHFRRIFKKETGKSPQQYLLDLRIEEAKAWLNNKHISIKEVADGCGFSDEFNFSRIFLKYTGLSPSRYRAQSSNKLSNYNMDNLSSFSYNKKSLVSLGKLKGKGEYNMLKQIKNKKVVAMALSLTLLLSACSGTPQNSGGESTSKIESSQSVNKETRVVKTVKGDVEVPANPKKVIVHYLMGDASAFGVNPIGVSEVHKGAAFEDSIKQASNLGSWDFELESVMKLDPDLIITVNEGQYEELSKIAPTVLVPYGDMTTQERINFLGEVLNKQEEAKKIISSYEEKIDQGKKKLKEAGIDSESITILRTDDKSNSVAGDKHALGILVYKELGLTPAKKVQEEIINKNEYWGQISLEVLSKYCGDYLIHLGDISKTISDNNVWKSIPAVKSEKVIIANTALTYYTDILSSEALIDVIVDGLVKISEKAK